MKFECCHAAKDFPKQGAVQCLAGGYGGEPHIGTCRQCPMRDNPAAKEYFAGIKAQYDKTHPPGVERVSGCCDPPAPL